MVPPTQIHTLTFGTKRHYLRTTSDDQYFAMWSSLTIVPVTRFVPTKYELSFVSQQNVEYTFLLTYSPDLNPVENCFGTIKNILSQERFGEIVANNLKLAIVFAIKEIQQTDLINFFKRTGYIYT